MAALSGLAFGALILFAYSAPGLIFALPGTAIIGYLLWRATGSKLVALGIGLVLSAAGLAVAHGTATPRADHYYLGHAVALASFYCWPLVLWGPRLFFNRQPSFYAYARQQATEAAYQKALAESQPLPPPPASQPTPQQPAADAPRFGKRTPAQPWGQVR